MSQTGRWLTGGRGAERIVKLSSELNRKSLSAARASSPDELSSYRPWMSCHDRLRAMDRTLAADAGRFAEMAAEGR